MPEQMFEVVVRATGEIRDADGNLVSTTPVEVTQICTAAEVAALTGQDPS